MTPAQLKQLAALAEVRKTRHLTELEAAMAEDRKLAAAIEDFARAPSQDLSGPGQALPFNQTALRHAWAEQNIAIAKKRRAELAVRIEKLRKVATRSLGTSEAIDQLTRNAEREEAEIRLRRAEREAPPPKPQPR